MKFFFSCNQIMMQHATLYLSGTVSKSVLKNSGLIVEKELLFKN